jgi:hypothetical protein
VWAKDFANFIYEHDELRIKINQKLVLCQRLNGK